MTDPTAVNRTLPGPTDVGPPSGYVIGTSEWWIDKLSRALAKRIARFELLESYFRGTQKLSLLAGQAWRESEVAAMFPNYLSANYSRLIVNSSAQRMVVLGFRLAGELRADTEAARIWRRNDMEALSDVAHTESLVKGECPVLIEPNPRDPATPLITPQRANEVIVWTARGDSRIRLAALKTWWDEDARRRLYILYLPDRIERWQDRQPGQMDAWANRLLGIEPARYERRETRDEPAVIKHDLGEVPVVVLPNEPVLGGMPEAEHEAALTQIDHYNKTLMNMAVTSHELAYPQRYGIGVDPEGNAETQVSETTGEPVAAPPAGAQTGQTRWITTPSPDAQFGQFAQATMDNYVKELDQIRGGIGTTTFTPYHFLLGMPSSVPPSGESITATEAAFSDKVRGHTRDKGAAWRSAMRLAFLVAGDTARAAAMADGHTLWGDPERRTESQHIDAVGKMAQMLKVPEEATWELIPVPPDEIARWRAMRDEGAEATPEKVDMVGIIIRSGYAPDAALKAVGLDPIKHMGLLPVTLQTGAAAAAVGQAALEGRALPEPAAPPAAGPPTEQMSGIA